MTTNSNNVATADVVIIEWDDLLLLLQPHENRIDSVQVVATTSKRIQDAIDQSYGCSNGIGVMAIRGVPNFVSYKDQFLIQAHALATKFTEEYRETHLTDPSSLYNAGWSYGKERLGHNKPPDTSKGSFYYNPVTDIPGTEQDRDQYPCSYPCNVWPPSTKANNDLLPNFQNNAKQIGLLLKDVAVEVAKHLDVYVQNCLLRLQEQSSQELSQEVTAPLSTTSTTSIQLNSVKSIYHHLKDTDKVKARLLYYYPLSCNKHSNVNARISKVVPPSNDIHALGPLAVTEDSWIGWHNDSGFLTALAGDIYVNHVTGERISSIQDIDPHAGLYVMDRSSTSCESQNRLLKVNIPYDCCAIQIGECVQIISGGTLCATPHCVRGCSSMNMKYKDIARISLPCFIDTPPSFPLEQPIGISRQEVLNADQFCHSKVPPLALRWKQTAGTFNFDDHNDNATAATMVKPMTFGEFLQETFQMYYGWESVAASDQC